MSELKLMHGTTGVYQTEYAGTVVTVRLFEAPELPTNYAPKLNSRWLAIVTYKNIETGVVARIDTDHITNAKVDHCREYAAQQDPTYGELFKAHMAHAYWRTIQ